MKFIIKLFPEITIKSRSVRLYFIKVLTRNIRNILKYYSESVTIVQHWDHIEVYSALQQRDQIIEILMRIPGIHHILEVEQRIWKTMHDIYQYALEVYHSQLLGKSFCVRVKRRGKHEFTSQDVERYVGSGLKQNVENTYVKLISPDKTILLEIDNHQLLLVIGRFEGIGGFPIGTQGDVLSLISGGFDSGVASYMLMRRGCRVHYCFFNLVGSIEYEISVRKVAYHLWSRFGFSHKVHFISINFTPVMHEILNKIDDSQKSIILKRMMVRTASTIANRYGIQVLVTGEVIGQVSSQTLTNLHLIDSMSKMLICRPLISYDKEDIIHLARQIGTEEFSKKIPEYCGAISKTPTVRATKTRIEQEEKQFDCTILDALSIKVLDIRKLTTQDNESLTEIEITSKLNIGDVVLDIRFPDEQKHHPLMINNIVVKNLPFYNLYSQFSLLDQSKSYLLYCDRGIMSKLQALYLREKGFRNIKVYQPILI
ncbi:tRNA uracil 4-sulfurtransferase ThiI [Candidatus Curculioniphilus buchneri]|uniref:tRNA uracil 4-sulfurtransferase ThiI n=1 Tax=Candidatus Curculioniphilus buchneri TaxID=690594 RepID=UPI00376EEEEE